eukprot:NODE_89_length_21810_cov_0.170098.p1 type:complete len:733 gc:universal NODE_89_length_21810_cov_0.170098:6226-4028(-)
MLKYSQLNWAEQVLSNNCLHHTQDIILINFSSEYLKKRKIPLYSIHFPTVLGKPNFRTDVPSAKLKKKLFTYKKHQRKRNINIHKNLLFLVDRIQTSPPVLPLPKKMTISTVSHETSHQIKISERVYDQELLLNSKDGKIVINTIPMQKHWPSLYDDFPISSYEQDLLAFSDLSIMCLLLFTNILKTDRSRWLNIGPPSNEPEIPFAIYDFVSKVIERTVFEFGPGSFLVPPTLSKSHYSMDLKEANHSASSNEYLFANNEITYSIKKSHKKSVSGTSLLKWVKKNQDKKMSNESDNSVNTLHGTTVTNSISPAKKSKKDKPVMSYSIPFDVYCEEKIINKLVINDPISVQYTERSCFMPMDTSIKKPSTIIASAFAGLNEVLIEWLQSKQPKIDHSWYDVTPLLAACCCSNLTSPECVALLLTSGADQMRGIRLGLYALIANLGNHLEFVDPLVKSADGFRWQYFKTSNKCTVDYSASTSKWNETFKASPDEFKFSVPTKEHTGCYAIKRIPRIILAQSNCHYLSTYMKNTGGSASNPNLNVSSNSPKVRVIRAPNIHSQVLPIDIACARNNWSIMLLLLRNNTSTVKHSLFILLCHQNVGVNAVLLKYNANAEMRTETGSTLLHVAARHGNSYMCLLALQYININDQDNVDQYTPLHEAIQNGHLECIQVLLWMGADPFLINSQGESAIGMAHLLYGKQEGTWIEVSINNREVVMQWEVFNLYFGRFVLT